MKKKKFGKAASNGYMKLSTTMFMKQKNVGLANYRVSFKCNNNKYVYEAKKCCNKNYWESFKCKFNKYVYEATNILFTFENRGGALKQTENRSLQTLLVMVLYQKQQVCL